MHHTMSGKGLKTLLIRPSEHLRSSFPQGIGSGCWLQAGLIHRFKKSSSYFPDGHSILLSYLPLSVLLASYLCFLLFPCAVWTDFCSGPATWICLLLGCASAHSSASPGKPCPSSTCHAPSYRELFSTEE